MYEGGRDVYGGGGSFILISIRYMCVFQLELEDRVKERETGL